MHICERRIVNCPKGEATHRLSAFVDEGRFGDGLLDMALRSPIEMAAATMLPIERRSATASYSFQSARHPNPAYSVSWSSKEGWAVPEFAGALAVEMVLLPNCFGLVLCGYYQPPLARKHPRFDFEAEWRVAHGLTREVLRSIADFIENTYVFRTRDPGRHQEALRESRIAGRS